MQRSRAARLQSCKVTIMQCCKVAKLQKSWKLRVVSMYQKYDQASQRGLGWTWQMHSRCTSRWQGKGILLKVEVREVAQNVLLLVICPVGLLHHLGDLLGRDRTLLNPPVNVLMQYVSQHLSYIVLHKHQLKYPTISSTWSDNDSSSTVFWQQQKEYEGLPNLANFNDTS